LYDDMFDDAVGTGDFEDQDDGLLETLAIIGLTAMIVGLLYYRQIRQQIHREREDARQRAAQGAEQGAVPAQQQAGFFPQPGDPEFANWAAGGVGH
jgi:SEL1 protein